MAGWLCDTHARYIYEVVSWTAIPTCNTNPVAYAKLFFQVLTGASSTQNNTHTHRHTHMHTQFGQANHVVFYATQGSKAAACCVCLCKSMWAWSCVVMLIGRALIYGSCKMRINMTSSVKNGQSQKRFLHNYTVQHLLRVTLESYEAFLNRL